MTILRTKKKFNSDKDFGRRESVVRAFDTPEIWTKIKVCLKNHQPSFLSPKGSTTLNGLLSIYINQS